MLVVLFEINLKKYGIKSKSVSEIVSFSRVDQFQKQMDSKTPIMGTLIHKEQRVPVIDLTKIISSKNSAEAFGSLAIIVEFQSKYYGLIAENVTRIAEVPNEFIHEFKKSKEPIIYMHDHPIRIIDYEKWLPDVNFD